MDPTLLKVLPLAIGATISPTGLLFVMMILSGKDSPKKKALSFILGATLFLIILGLIIFFTAKPAIQSTNRPDVTSSIIDIVLGILIVLIVIKSVFFKKKDKQADSKKHKKPYSVIGFLYMFINVSTLIPFIAAIKIIAENKLAPLDDLSMVIAVILITMFMVAFPVIITYAMPKKSEAILGPINGFMSKHGSTIANVYFMLMAIYLIYAGIHKL